MNNRSEDGEPSLRLPGNGRGTQNEDKPTTTEGDLGANHVGTSENKGRFLDFAEDDTLVKLETILRRFNEETGNTLRPRTKEDYGNAFRRFSKKMNLERHSRKQLGGSMGRKLVLQHLNGNISRRSWGVEVHKLKSVWTNGLGLPWPLLRKDTPPAVPKRSTRSPVDQIVLPWKNALQSADAYTRVELRLYGDLGLRPSHLRSLQWQDVKNDRGEVCWSSSPDDQPFAIEADGFERGFKNFAWVRAWLPPALAADLQAWRKELGSQWGPERCLLPFRDRSGHLEPARPQAIWAQDGRWGGYIKRWELPRLTPRAFRKFVRTKCVESGMDIVARSYLQGHAPPGMDGRYDNPEMMELAARQSRALPKGALEAILDPTVKVMDNVTKAEVEMVAAWKAKQIGDFELVDGLRRLSVATTATERMS